MSFSAGEPGIPALLQQFLIWTPGLLIASIAAGTLIGVLFIGRSLAAPAGTGMGVLLAYAGLIPLQELMVAQGNGATRTGHITLASPAVLLERPPRRGPQRPDGTESLGFSHSIVQPIYR